MKKVLLLSLLGSTAAMAQVSAPLVSEPAFFATSEPIEQMAMRAQASAFAVRDFRIQRNHDIDKQMHSARAALAREVSPSVSISAPAPFLQTATYQALGAPVGANFEGLGLGTPGYSVNVAPPDTTLAVSPTQVVQWVNSHLAVYDKSGNKLLPSPGFVAGNTIWANLGSGSLCATTNRGDPIVQYDRINQRWILSQFAFNTGFTQNSQCIAVSQTSNAAGAYYLYEYSFGNVLPDYGKLGVWTDGYYITYNMFTTGSSFAGGRACAYDGAKMRAGQAASQICFNNTSRFSYLPSDLDGTTLPPAGTPNVHISWDWAFLAAPPYTVQLTKFKPDFVTPANSKFDDGFGGATGSFVGIALDNGTLAACGDNGNNCVPQLGTSQLLDTLGSRHMYRLVYSNFGSYDALLITQAVDASATANEAQVRWMEIRNPAANPPVVYQNSTFRPNGTMRWMSSAAFDKLGNIGIGYSASSSSMNPAINVTGRRRTDAKNILRAEQVVFAGTGSQGVTRTLSRWGDYSTMQIDPADECTFWYTTQYIATTGTFNWNTRIASFKFPNCQ